MGVSSPQDVRDTEAKGMEQNPARDPRACLRVPELTGEHDFDRLSTSNYFPTANHSPWETGPSWI